MSKYSKIYNLCKKIEPVYRSLTGSGNYKTLKILKKMNKNLKIISFDSNSKVIGAISISGPSVRIEEQNQFD